MLQQLMMYFAFLFGLVGVFWNPMSLMLSSAILIVFLIEGILDYIKDKDLLLYHKTFLRQIRSLKEKEVKE
jgi:hypothetical protein